MEFLSCEWIEYRVVLECRELRFCCVTHGKNKGFVPICDFNGGELPVDTIRTERDRLRELNNKKDGSESPCHGCYWLKRGTWDKLPGNALFDRVEINNFTICNLRCNYCYTVINKDWDLPLYAYELKPLFERMISDGVLADNLKVEWAGGESTVLKDFDSVFDMLSDHGAYQTVFTNAVIFSEKVGKALKQGKAFTVTSVDAGTRETYLKVKGRDHFDTVWRNIKRYAETGGSVVVKYILKSDNSDEKELLEFVRRCEESKVGLIAVALDSREVGANTVTAGSLFGAALIALEAGRRKINCEIQYERFGDMYANVIRGYLLPSKRIKYFLKKKYDGVRFRVNSIIREFKPAEIISESLTGRWHSESGHFEGLSLEAQGDKLFFAWHFPGITPRWLAALVVRKNGTGNYIGNMSEWRGTPLGESHSAPIEKNIGPVSINFPCRNKAVFLWDDKKMLFRKTDSKISGVGTVAYDGWWYDPEYEGMGFFIETRKNTLDIMWYYYGFDNRPKWCEIKGEPGCPDYAGIWSGKVDKPDEPDAIKNGERITFAFAGNRRAAFKWKGIVYHLERLLFSP